MVEEFDVGGQSGNVTTAQKARRLERVYAHIREYSQSRAQPQWNKRSSKQPDLQGFQHH